MQRQIENIISEILFLIVCLIPGKKDTPNLKKYKYHIEWNYLEEIVVTSVNFQENSRRYFAEDREQFNNKSCLCHFCMTASTPDPLPRKAFRLFISFHGVSNVH
jgi:hypothetical protein